MLREDQAMLHHTKTPHGGSCDFPKAGAGAEHPQSKPGAGIQLSDGLGKQMSNDLGKQSTDLFIYFFFSFLLQSWEGNCTKGKIKHSLIACQRANSILS